MGETKMKLCDCCGKVEVGTFEVCPNCNWQEDRYALNYPDRESNVNDMTLNEARKAYKEGRPVY